MSNSKVKINGYSATLFTFLKVNKIIKIFFGKAYQLFSRVTFSIALKVTKRSRRKLNSLSNQSLNYY